MWQINHFQNVRHLNMKKFIFWSVFAHSVLLPFIGNTEEIDVLHLKNGEIVQGTILGKNDKNIEIEVLDKDNFRTVWVYRVNEVEKIDMVKQKKSLLKNPNISIASGLSGGVGCLFSFSQIPPILGLGQFYNGEYEKALLFLTLGGLSSAAFAYSLRDDEIWGNTPAIYGASVYLGTYFWSIVDAYQSAKRVNREIDTSSVPLSTWKIETKSSLYGELLGNGIVYGLNYEYFIKDDLPIRIGVGRWSSNNFLHTTVPITFSILKGKSNHKLELGGGGLFHRIYSEVKPVSSFGIPPDPVFNEFHKHEVYLLGLVGYRYQKLKRGGLFRLTYTPAISTLTDVQNQLIWFGLSAGYTF